MGETWVRSLGWENPLERRMTTHSSILIWRIPWTEEPGRLQSMQSQSQTQLSDFHFQHLNWASLVAQWLKKKKKNPPANTGNMEDMDLIPGSERYPTGGNGNPLQYSCLETAVVRRA